jgi:hypothetical protein
MRNVTVIRFATRAAVSCLLLGTIVKTSAAQYEVEGHIEQTIYNMDGSVQWERNRPFTVFVKDCSWLIQTTNIDENGSPVAVHETASTNGGVIYSVDAPLDKATPIGGAPSWNDATIYSNDVPVDPADVRYVGHLWLMFASGCHLKNLSTNRLEPVYDLNALAGVSRLLKRQARWELAGGPGSLPTNVTYFENGPESPINATYVATGVTNVGDLRIASGFVFEQRAGIFFAPGPTNLGDTSPAYHIRQRAVATVTAVRPSCSCPEFVPTALGLTHVIDERLCGMPNPDPAMYYVFPDGVRWVSVSEAKRLAAAQSPPKNPPSKLIVVAILLLPAAAVLLLWRLNRSKGQTPPVISNSERRNPQNSGESPVPSNPSSNP